MSAASLEFRTAAPGDAAELGHFMVRNFLAAYGHCSTPENVQAAVLEHYGEAAQLRQIIDAERFNLLAVQAGSWVGHAQLHFNTPAPPGAEVAPALEISRFYVDTLSHGKGVAQAMMAHLKQRAREHGAASLWLSVWQEQPQAIRFYQKEGFTIAGNLVFKVGNDPKDDWLMVCPL